MARFCTESHLSCGAGHRCTKERLITASCWTDLDTRLICNSETILLRLILLTEIFIEYLFVFFKHSFLYMSLI